MRRRYGLIAVGDWQLDGMSFDGRALLQYLHANERTRPSGIARVTDDQLAADTDLPLPRVRSALRELGDRGQVLREGAWLWVVEHFGRIPKTRLWLAGARDDVRRCTSAAIVRAWGERYPHHMRWADDRLRELRPTPAPGTTRAAAPREPAPKPPGNSTTAAAAGRETFRGGEPERAGAVLGPTLDRLRREAGSA